MQRSNGTAGPCPVWLKVAPEVAQEEQSARLKFGRVVQTVYGIQVSWLIADNRGLQVGLLEVLRLEFSQV